MTSEQQIILCTFVLHIQGGNFEKLTIPRLELCAAILLSKLYKKAVIALNITVNEAYMWTDSAIVLAWIQGPSTK